jgi:tetratricopeptide (TPR) repeat protein
LQFDKAVAEFQESIRLQPAQSEAWYQLGDIALKQQQFEQALTDFGHTLDRNPRHGGALAGSGEALFREKQYEKALDFLDRAIAAAPDYQTGHYYRGLTLSRLGRKQDSEKELATAAALADAENKKSATRYQLTMPNQP